MEAIKAIAKEGTDLTEIEGLIAGLNPLSGLKTKEEAYKFIRKTPLLSQTYDKYQRQDSETAIENFKSTKMQEEWKAREEALRKEYNPEESEADKKLRAMEETIKAMEGEKSLNALKTDLSKKAKELEFDTIKAQDYAVYGEKAMEKLESDAKWFKDELENRLSSELKDKYKGNQQPSGKEVPPADLDTEILKAREAGDYAKALRLQMAKNKKQP